MLAEREGLALAAVRGDQLDLGDTVGQLQGGFQRVGEAALDAVAPDEAVDDDLDLVLLVPGKPLVALQELGDVDDLAIDPGTHVALTGEILQQRVVVALAAAHDGCEHLEPRAIGQQEDAIDDLLGRLTLQPGAVVGAVLHADSGVQEAQVVVDLGDRANRGSRVAAGRLLVDRDGWGQPLDHVDVGLVHLPEELPGIGAEALDVPALALGVDGVEREAALAGPGQSGEHDHLVARQLHVDVSQIVLARATNNDLPGFDCRHCGEATQMLVIGRCGTCRKTYHRSEHTFCSSFGPFVPIALA